MRHFVLPLLFALPLVNAQAGHHDHHHHDHDAHGHHAHDNLGAHQHGAAQLDVALEGGTLVIMLKSPAANLVGFEHAPATADEHEAIERARAQLAQPARLFGLPEAAGCTVDHADLHGPLLEPEHGKHGAEHSDIEASYSLTCKQPQALERLDLQALFNAFPATESIQVQAFVPAGQQAAELSAKQPVLVLTR